MSGFVSNPGLSRAPTSGLKLANAFGVPVGKLTTTLIEKAVDDDRVVPYDSRNTGKEVIQKYMSSNHSEVAAA